MRPEHWQRLRTLFEAARELEPGERDAFLVGACDDDDLLREARAMVAADVDDGGSPSRFLDPLTAGGAGGLRPTTELRPGARVGSFELGAPLASGGMGTVWEAWQDEPRRRVALKVLRGGLADDSAVRRFRFEAELLGRLRHPGIAPVHEAGLHRGEDGAETPYIAMEFVDGARDVLTYAREEALDLRARLALAIEACAAVQHGHQLGVVHRDLKPQNILVDGAGRVRLIDFGIARAVGRENGADALDGTGALGPATQLTAAGEILGTLSYMSPEQFAGDSTRIDTRSDVYALGVVLHELVADRRPFDLAGKSLLEIARTVCEQAPAPPSAVPEDLGWIVCKALATEAEERYASASELAADLERFLADEPVEAGAPTRTYRFKKFVRRNRAAVVLGSVAAAALAIGSIAALVGLLEAQRARDDFERQRDVAVAEADKFEDMAGVLTGMFLGVTPEQDGREVRVADLLDQASAALAGASDPGVEAAVRRVMGLSYRNLDLRADALAEFEAALALTASVDDPDPQLVAQLRADLAGVLAGVGRFAESLALADVGLREASARLGDEDPLAFELAAARANALIRAGRAAEALPELEDEVLRAEAVLGPEAETTLALRRELAAALSLAERHAEALATLRETARRAAATLGPTDRRTLDARYATASELKALGRRDEGRAVLEELLPLYEAAFGRTSARTCQLVAKLAELLSNDGEFAAAYALLAEAVPCLEATLDASSPAVVQARGNFAALVDRMGDDAAAVPLRRGALEAAERYYGADDLRTLHHAHNLAILLERLGESAEALALEDRVIARRRAALGDDHADTLEALEIRAKALLGLGRLPDALEANRELLDARTRTLGPDSPLTLRVHNELVNVLGYLGQLDEALEEGQRMLTAHRRAVPETDPSRVLLLNNLASLAQEARQYETALDYFGQAHRVAGEHLPPESFDRALATLGLGETRVLAGDLDGALAPLRQAAEHLRLRPGAHPDQRARAHGTLGVALFRLERYDEARGEFERALEFYGRVGDERRLASVQQFLDAIPPDTADG